MVSAFVFNGLWFLYCEFVYRVENPSLTTEDTEDTEIAKATYLSPRGGLCFHCGAGCVRQPWAAICFRRFVLPHHRFARVDSLLVLPNVKPALAVEL